MVDNQPGRGVGTNSGRHSKPVRTLECILALNHRQQPEKDGDHGRKTHTD